MRERPWYEDGLPFACSGCGQCCTGDPGHVWVNQAEINAIAAAVGMDPETFERQHVVAVGTRRSLRERANGDCVLFDRATMGCRVYSVRPRQCRTWPFWDSNLRSPSAWRQVCRDCPGAGQGPVVPLEQIEAQRSVIEI